MLELESQTCRLTVDDNGVIEVWTKQGPEVRVIQIGTYDKSFADAAAKLAQDLAKYPAFRGCNCDLRTFWVDVEVGVQRFHGTQPASKVAEYLQSCGFDASKVAKVMQLAKKHEHEWLDRVCM